MSEFENKLDFFHMGANILPYNSLHLTLIVLMLYTEYFKTLTKNSKFHNLVY